jgi:transposase
MRKEKSKRINVGIDIGKRFCQAALKADDGRLLNDLRFENTTQGVEELIRRITVHGKQKPSQNPQATTGSEYTLENHGVRIGVGAEAC